MAETTLDVKREREREKYLILSGKRLFLLAGMRYGASNHGRRAVKQVAAWQPRFVVDFGCGNNAFIHALRKRGVEGVGIDFANPRADLCTPMHDVPLESGVADVVTCFDALEHLLPEDVEPVLREMQRVARPANAGDQSQPPSRFTFTISTRRSTIKVNGENLHPTVRPMKWWLRRISQYGKVTSYDRRRVEGIWRASPWTVRETS